MRTTSLATALACVLASAAFAAAPPEVGQPVPDWKLPDETGAMHSLSQYRGSAVVLEWTNPDCPYVARHYKADTMEKLAKSLGAKQVVWLAVNSTHSNKPEDTREWRSEQGFQYGTLQDPDGTLGKALGARTTPHMFLIDAQGVLRYRGAIDDDPRGKNTTPVNYLDGAAQALFAGAAPNPSDTSPYGCSVKYKD